MSEWKEYKLGDLVKSVSDTYKFNTGEKVVFLNTSDILDGEFLHHTYSDTNTLPGQAKKKIQRGDILFSEIRPANRRFAMVNFDCDDYVVSTKLMVLRCNEKIDNSFLYLFLTSKDVLEYLQMVAEDRSGTFPQITFDIIANMDVSLPPLDEQKRIAGVLSSLDDKIDLLHRENATLEALAETLFRHYFIENPCYGVGSADNPTWKEGKLGEFINIGSGKALKHNDFVNEGLYPVLGANGEIGRANEYLVNETDRVLYTGRVGTLGKVFRLEGERAWLSDNTLVIKPKCHFNYVYFLLKQANLQDLDVGSTQPLIRQSDVVDIDVIIPNDSIIDAFEKEVCPLFEKIKSNQQQILTLTAQRNTLLSRIMSGELKVA